MFITKQEQRELNQLPKETRSLAEFNLLNHRLETTLELIDLTISNLDNDKIIKVLRNLKDKI